MNEFFTWSFLATFAGIGVFTGVVTGFLKKYVPIPTQLFAYCVALAGLLLALFFTDALTVSSGVLSLFNAVLIASATSGTYDTVRRLKDGK